MPTPGTTQRYLEIDLLRTIALLLMVLYHFVFDLSFFYNIGIDPTVDGWLVLERITANLFLLVSGASAAISYGRSGQHLFVKKSLKRFLILFACGALVSVVTFLVLGDVYVRFGILQLLAVSALLLPLFLPLKSWNLLLGVLAIILGEKIGTILLPTSLLLPLGIRPIGFVSVDYFPLFPWIGTILIGSALGHLLYNRGLLRIHVLPSAWMKKLTAPGRHSLSLYLLHQPILMGIAWIISKMVS